MKECPFKYDEDETIFNPECIPTAVGAQSEEPFLIPTGKKLILCRLQSGDDYFECVGESVCPIMKN